MTKKQHYCNQIVTRSTSKHLSQMQIEAEEISSLSKMSQVRMKRRNKKWTAIIHIKNKPIVGVFLCKNN